MLISPAIAVACKCGPNGTPHLDYIKGETVRRLIYCGWCGETLGMIELPTAVGT